MTELNRKSNKGVYLLLIIATFFMYVTLTSAKNIYVAEKTTLEALGSFGSYTDLAATMEYYFYSYAATQIILIFFIKKVDVKWYLALTLGASAILTCVMAFTGSITHHWIIYIVNGVLQAGVWSCSMKTLAKYLPSELLPTGNKLMSSGPAVSGAVCYAVAALFGDNWRAPFLLLGGVLLFAVVLFFVSVNEAAKLQRAVETHRAVQPCGSEADVSEEQGNDFIHLKNKKRIIVFYFASAIIAFIVTAVFFFLYNNLDLFLKQVGGFDNTTSKLVTIIAPIVIVAGPYVTVNACEKHKNFIFVGAVMFGVATVFLILLTLLFKVNIILSLLLFVGFSIFANGGRMIPLSIVPLRMRKSVDSGVYSAVANAAASVASGVAPKLLAMIVDNAERGTESNWSLSFIIATVACVGLVAILFALCLFIHTLNKKDESAIA